MLRGEFDVVMCKLKECYGAAKYPEVRLEQFFKRFSVLSREVFERGVETAISSEASAPLLPRMTELLQDDLRQAWEKSPKARPSASFKTGVIDIAHLEGEWFFDDHRIFTRGRSAKECRVILREDNPDHPLVIKAVEKQKECLAGRAKFIAKAGTGYPLPTKEMLDFFYPLRTVNKKLSEALDGIVQRD